MPRADEVVEQLVHEQIRQARKGMPHGGRIKASRRQRDRERQAVKLRKQADEITRALDKLADQRYRAGTLEVDEHDRQTRRFLEERAAIEAEAQELEALAASVRPVDLDVLDSWDVVDNQAKRDVIRVLVEAVTVGPAQGRGRGARVGDRLDVRWLT